LTVNKVETWLQLTDYNDGHITPGVASDRLIPYTTTAWFTSYHTFKEVFDPDCMSYTATTWATFENDTFCGVTFVYYNPNNLIGWHNNDYSHTWAAAPNGACNSLLKQQYLDY